MMPSNVYEKVEYLMAENAQLKRQLGIAVSRVEAEALAEQWGLTAVEARFLLAIYHAPGRTATKDTLHHALYGDDPDGGPHMKIIDIWLCKVRKKVRKVDGIEVVETLWGRGLAMTRAGAEAVARALGGSDLGVAA